jgi:hypothetical protein
VERTVSLRVKDSGGNDTVQSDFRYDLEWARHAEVSESFQDTAAARPAAGSAIAAQMTTKNDRLQFRDSGPGNGGEMRGAFSHIYGRFFARGLLEWHFGVENLLPITGPNPMSTRIGVTTSMKPGKTGNMPDWLGTHAVEYVLGEAKGSYKGSAKSWLTMTPPHKCVEASLEQINNCQLVDSTGTVITSDRWAVANLWATDENKRPPVMIAWDPPGDGHKVPEDQWPQHEKEMRLR